MSQKDESTNSFFSFIWKHITSIDKENVKSFLLSKINLESLLYFYLFIYLFIFLIVKYFYPLYICSPQTEF